MKLHWSPRSPFVRKVMITLHECGQLENVDLVRSVVSLSAPPNSAVLIDNPLGKIPTLITDDGDALFDSRVICEYLDIKSGRNLFPAKQDERMKHLRWQALCDGLADILLLWRIELTRQSGPWDIVTDGWQTKVRASMAVLEGEVEAFNNSEFGIGHISLICALGQLEFRWSNCDWRKHFPKLSNLEADLAKRPSINATGVKDDQENKGTEITNGQLSF